MKSNLRKRLNLWHANQRSNWKNRSLTKEYEDLKRKCTNEVKSVVKKYEKNLANNVKNNPKMLYAYVNSKKVIKDNIRVLNDENGIKVEDPAEIVRILNNQFKYVFEVDNGEKPEFSRVKRTGGI